MKSPCDSDWASPRNVLDDFSYRLAKAYCINCDGKQPYKLKTTREEITVRGTTFSYLEHTAYCAECGDEIYVAEVNDMNAQAREDAYRKASSLVTISEIK